MACGIVDPELFASRRRASRSRSWSPTPPDRPTPERACC
jgi:hypothetical protein